jgi:transcription initiation factor TFIIIB Brf1 subunit/transcription initiation factor TFIIB
MTMYTVIRCPGCHSFTYIDRYQHWKLCHTCGEVIDVSKAPVYVEVESHRDAEEIAGELETYLHASGKNDLTGDEKERLRAEYARLVRSRM